MVYRKGFSNIELKKICLCFVLFADLHYLLFAKEFPLLNEDKQQQIDANLRYRRSIPNELEAKVVVDKHNKLRSLIGGDGEKPVPSNMRRLTWDDGLAYTALTYAKSCKWGHSEKNMRKTQTFKSFIGQNLWLGQGDLAINFDPDVGIRSWFNEGENFNFHNLTCKAEKCTQFTQLVWANTYKVGCGWKMCDKLGSPPYEIHDVMYMVCHYAPGGNIPGEAPYLIGPRCSKCNVSDTCPNKVLCHNKLRDEMIPFNIKSSSKIQSAAIISFTLSGILIVTMGAVVYWIYLKKCGTSVCSSTATRRSRKISFINAKHDNAITNKQMTKNDVPPSVSEGKCETKIE